MKRTLLFLLAASLLGSCNFSQEKKTTLAKPSVFQINIQDDPSTLDPRKVRDLASQTVVRMLFDGLSRVNKQEETELALAQRVDVSEDLKTYTFHLRKTAWSNGDPVKAEDFVYAWKKVLSPHFPSDYAAQLYIIKNGKKAKEDKISLDEVGVFALDEKTLKVELEEPIPYLLELLSSPIFFPINSKTDIENPSWSQRRDSFVSCGPFSLKEWRRQDSIVLEKNNAYWDASSVKLSEVKMVMVTEDTALKMFEKQELDWIGSPLSVLPIDAVKHLKSSPLLHTKALQGTYFYRINTAKPPLHNASIRKALALAVSRKEILDHITHGTQLPATSLIPSKESSSFFADGDVKKARALFDRGLLELGLSADQFPVMILTYASSERSHLIAQAVQQQWANILGIHVQLEAVENKVFYQRVSKQDYELAGGSWIADFSDPINFLEVFKHKTATTNNTNWENEEYVHLLDKSKQVQDPKERLALLKRGERILMDEMPIIPIFHYTMLYLKDDRIKDVALSSMGNLDVRWAYIENGEKAR